MAKAFGGYGERVIDPIDVVTALRRDTATAAGKPALLEFVTDKEIDISNE